nr:hypothetical protein [Mycobacterium asiaticum]
MFPGPTAGNSWRECVDDDLGEWDGSNGSASLWRSDDYSAFYFRCGLANFKPTCLEVDVADAEADQFGPAKSGEGQDCDDVALVAACRRQGDNFAGREIAVAFSHRHPPRRHSLGRVDVNSAVFASHVEN